MRFTASDFASARSVQRQLLTEVAKHGYDKAAAFAIRLAVEEGMNNALKHGTRMDPAKSVEVELDIDPRRAVVTVTDGGDGFDPNCVPDPTNDENLRKPRGRGLMLMKAYMDEMRFNDRGNQVTMMKRNA